MIAVDTNILARFYCDDPDDPEAARQQIVAKRVMVESEAIFVPLTVILEFEWVMRGFYEAEPASCGMSQWSGGRRSTTQSICIGADSTLPTRFTGRAARHAVSS